MDTDQITAILDSTPDRRSLAYAFVGWLFTCITWQGHGLPDEPDGEWIRRLGMTSLGWRFDAACRNGWALVEADPDALAWAKKHLLPLASRHIVGCLTAETVSR
jgi:hypothetical protein